MKRVLIAVLNIPPYAGGAENAAWQLAKRLQKYFDVYVLTSGKKERIYSIEGIIVYEINSVKPYTVYFEILYKKKIHDFIRKNKIDIINIHGTLPFGYLLKDIPHKKIITCHGMERAVKGIHKNNIFFKSAVNDAINKASLLVSPGKKFGQFLEANFKIPVEIIPNGIDSKVFRNLNIKRERKSIIFVGRYVKIKGIEMVVRIAGIMPDYNFYFVGKGPFANKINLTNTKNLGFMGHSALVALYNRCEFALFPSIAENMPLVCIEAMACGTVVVASPPGFEELIDNGKNGFIVNKYSAEEFRDTLLGISNRKAVQKMAFDTAKQYSWEHVAKKYAETINKIV